MLRQPRFRPLALATLACLGLSAGAAQAHGIESRLSPLRGLTDQLLLQSQFSNGEPTRDAVVRLVPPQGQPLELGRTDGQGQLSFALPKGAHGAWELQVDGGPGHRDYLEMPLQGGQAQLDRVSRQPHPARSGWLLGLSGLGAAAMLLGLQRVRSPR